MPLGRGTVKPDKIIPEKKTTETLLREYINNLEKEEPGIISDPFIDPGLLGSIAKLAALPVLGGMKLVGPIYKQIIAKDASTNKLIKVFLKNVKDDGKFLSGIEVNKFGEEIIPKNATERLHIIDKTAIKKSKTFRTNPLYGELEEEK